MPDPNELGFQTAEAVSNLDKLTGAINRYNLQTEDIISTMARFNETGTKTASSITTLNELGQKIQRTYQLIDGVMTNTGTTVKTTTQSFADQIKALSALAAQGSLLDKYFKIASNGAVMNKTGGFASKAQVQEVKDLEDQVLQALVEGNQQIVNAQKKADVEIELDLKEAQVKREALQNADAEQWAEYYEKIYLKALEGAEKLKIANNQITEILLQGDIAQDEERKRELVEEAQDQNRRWALYQEEVNARKTQQAQLSVILAQAKNKSANDAHAGLVGQAFANNLNSGVDFGKATAQQAQQVRAAFARITEIVQSGSVSAARAIEIMNSAIKNSGEVFTGSERKIASAATSAQRVIENFGESSKSAFERITISYQQVLRFLQFRLLYAGLFKLASALKEGVETSKELSIAIGEIKTISQDAGLSTSQWSNQLRNLSDALGQPVEQVAKGTYETISNQIAKGAEATTFMGEAMRFAQTTVSSTADSVDLLSSAINSYHLQASDANRISAIFFKTIDLGRVTATELHDTFGRVGPIAHTLGITLEETNAAIATLTIKGIRSDEALTGLTNVMNSLLKPTDEMKKLYAQWGVETGDQAIKTFGFVGVLRKLQDATQGSTSELAKFFQNIRGLKGAVGLTGDAFQDYESTLRKFTTNVLPEYQKAQQEAFMNPGFQIQQQLNKIRNSFIEFGDSAISVALGIGEKFGGGNGIAGVVEKLTAAVRIGVEAWALYKISILAVSGAEVIGSLITKSENLVDTLGKVARITAVLKFAGVAAAIAGVTYIIEDQIAAYDNLMNARRRYEADWEASYSKIREKINAIIDDESRLTGQGIAHNFELRLQGIAAVRASLTRLIDDEKNGLKETAKATQDTFDVLAKSIETTIAGIEKTFNQAVANVQKAQGIIEKTNNDYSGKVFSLEYDSASDLKKIDLVKARLDELKQESAALLTTPTNDPQQAGKNLDQAEDKRKEASKLLVDQQKQVGELTKQRAALEERIKTAQTHQADRGDNRKEQDAIKAAELQLKVQVERNRKHPTSSGVLEARAALQAAKDAATATSRKGQDTESGESLTNLEAEKKSIDVLLAQLPSVEDAKQAILDIEKESVANLQQYQVIQQQIADKAQQDLVDQRNRFETLKTTIAEIAKFKLDKGVKDQAGASKSLSGFDDLVNKAINEGGLTDPATILKFNEMRVELSRKADATIAENTLGAQEDTLGKLKEQFTNLNTSIAGSQKSYNDELAGSVGKMRALGVEMKATLDYEYKIAGGRVGSYGEKATKALEDYTAAVEKLDKGDFSKKNLATLQESFGTLSQAADLGGRSKLHYTRNSGDEQETDANLYFRKPDPLTGDKGRSLRDIEDEATAAIRKLLTLPEQQKQIGVSKQQLEATLKAIGVQKAAAQATANSTGQTIDFQVDFTKEIQSSSTSLINLTNQVNVATTAIANWAATFPQSTPVGHHAEGGLIHGPHGRDVIPAMLTSGEFVVNASSAKKNLGLLWALNSKKYNEGGLVSSLPNYHRGGGFNLPAMHSSANQMNIGDVNISGVPISGNVQVDAKAFAKAFKQAVRNGDIRS